MCELPAAVMLVQVVLRCCSSWTSAKKKCFHLLYIKKTANGVSIYGAFLCACMHVCARACNCQKTKLRSDGTSMWSVLLRLRNQALACWLYGAWHLHPKNRPKCVLHTKTGTARCMLQLWWRSCDCSAWNSSVEVSGSDVKSASRNTFRVVATDQAWPAGLVHG